MRYDTHIATSLCGGIALTMLTDTPLSVLYVSGIVIGSLLPDVDEPDSYIGKRTPGVSHAANGLLGHRGFTHSLPFCLLVSLLVFFYPNPLVIGLCVGYFMHVVGDMFSVLGIPLFLPFSKKRIRIPLYKTGGIREKVLYVSAVLLLIYLSQWHATTLVLSAVILHFAQTFVKQFKKRLHLF